MTEITRKPAFWIAFAVISALSGAFAWRFFPQALPLIKLDVKMTRDDALDRASALAGKLDLAPVGARRAALFTHDGVTQNFVELDAGGKARFAELLAGNTYAPYWWEVRLFRPNETAEARVRFRPDGSPYGFQLKVPEAEPGAALEAGAARAIAEARAVGDWAIDFAPYKLLEHSDVRRSGGRVDHAFVYEREQETLGDGRFRLRLGVAGDRLSEVSHYVYVPEAFKLRFQEMRSDNETIAKVASLAAAALYGIGGCIVGTLWLLRRRALLWKRAIVAGAIVAGINALALIASAPQAWFSYDTAQPVWVFWAAQVGLSLLLFLVGSLGLALVFMAAEGLSRLAFPDHPQLWRIWSGEAAPTPAILGRTLGGYLFVPIELALIAAFYFMTNRYFGWWQPSESLTDPNILGSALPALAPIGMALQAGFMEECLFRAVPLSIAALIGRRFGHRSLLIGLTLVLQAVIFGAAHANYPGFPAYSRLVELVIPAFIWGLVFLRFGLLTTVILHAVFDLVLMSIPVFLVEGSGSGFNQALVLAAGLVPLAIVALHRVRAGKWLELPAILRNGAWLRGAAVAEVVAARTRAQAGHWTTLAQRALPALGVAGLLAIAFGADFHSDAPPLQIDRAKAEEAADAALKNRGIMLGPEWRQAAATKLASEDATWLWHKFVWREGGRDAYAHLIGSWLAPPLWEVRYARFEGGDVVDRSEEWRVTVAGDGAVRQVRHQLPERAPGAKLSRDEARIIARKEVSQRFELDPEALREVSVKDDPQPARNDWKFTFSDPRVDAGIGGEARVGVDIAGAEVVSSGRYVFVPEAWQRAETDRAGRLGVAKNIVAMAIVVVVIAALIASIVAWSRSRFDRRAFWIAASLTLLAAAINTVNQWPLLGMRLSTTEPVTTQVSLYLAGILLTTVLSALLGGLLAGVASFAARAHVEPGLTQKTLWMRGAGAALFILGVEALLGRLSPDMAPTWPSYKVEELWVPWLGRISGTLTSALMMMTITVIVLYWLDRLTAGWTRRRALGVVVLVLAQAAMAAANADQWIEVVAAGVVGGALATLIYATVLRFDLRIAPALIAVYLVVGFIGDAAQKHTTQATMLALIASATALALALAVTRYLLQPGERTVAWATAD
ncbi:MAG TPA: type II CAAX endopeptidase family protein [Casimicrobiaceae bacterium]|nr:type II CAAX endopeptidase family protein [Casimicrobiaceae bacterium]